MHRMEAQRASLALDRSQSALEEAMTTIQRQKAEIERLANQLSLGDQTHRRYIIQHNLLYCTCAHPLFTELIA